MRLDRPITLQSRCFDNNNLAELKRRLFEVGGTGSPEMSNGSGPAHIGAANMATFARPTFNLSSSASPDSRSEIALPRAGLDVPNDLRSVSPASIPRSTPPASSPEILPANDLTQLMFLGWNADLPSPEVMRQLYV